MSYLDLLPEPIGAEIFELVRKSQQARMAPVHEELSTCLGTWRWTLDEHAILRIELTERMTRFEDSGPGWSFASSGIRRELLPFSFAKTMTAKINLDCEILHWEMWDRDSAGCLSRLGGLGYAT